jgi:polyhydroxyalkanoate synthase
VRTAWNSGYDRDYRRHTRSNRISREIGGDRAARADAAPVPASADDRDSYAVTALADVLDRSLHAVAARFTAGLSPAAMAHAHLDWATHLAYSPGKRLQLLDKAMRKAIR